MLISISPLSTAVSSEIPHGSGVRTHNGLLHAFRAPARSGVDEWSAESDGVCAEAQGLEYVRSASDTAVDEHGEVGAAEEMRGVLSDIIQCLQRSIGAAYELGSGMQATGMAISPTTTHKSSCLPPWFESTTASAPCCLANSTSCPVRQHQRRSDAATAGDPPPRLRFP